VRSAKVAARAGDLLPVIRQLQASGVTSANAIAKALNERGIGTARGGAWRATQVQRVLDRAGR
jgi:Recombinase